MLISFLGVGLTGWCQAGGNVVAWGYYYDTTIPETYRPMYVPAGLSNVVAVAGAYNYALALKSDGKIVAWGYGGNGQTNVPPSVSNVVAVAAGAAELALRDDGRVISWTSPAPTNLTDVVAVSVGFGIYAALRRDGTVVTGGGGLPGPPVPPPGLTNVVAIACGDVHVLALTEDGTVTAWSNYAGYTNVPMGLDHVIAISARGGRNLALKSDGTVMGWGFASASAPPGLSNVVSIACGAAHSLALKEDGTVVAWGAGTNVATDCCSIDRGQSIVPAGLTNVFTVAGGRSFSLAITNSLGPQAVAITNAVRNANQFGVSVPTQSGHVYRLEYKNSLADTLWTALPLVAGNGGMLALTDSYATTAQRFYRVRYW